MKQVLFCPAGALQWHIPLQFCHSRWLSQEPNTQWIMPRVQSWMGRKPGNQHVYRLTGKFTVTLWVKHQKEKISKKCMSTEDLSTWWRSAGDSGNHMDAPSSCINACILSDADTVLRFISVRPFPSFIFVLYLIHLEYIHMVFCKHVHSVAGLAKKKVARRKSADRPGYRRGEGGELKIEETKIGQ